ncbi:MerR family transcriptional regulator [Nocardia barduliensis]|uniref:MerR family transcriptional regulator n=1 Tax=Nocardia barduliensis TaxID=2736643 RepID=UPI001573DE7B|nr:MerR family transcriptional regulator [Nocardia barduliensis]
MRIRELADVVGITTRAVRHYHRIGLLPEPPRQANGYRRYSLRDAVELARIRRLTELGLSLDEVRDVLAEDAGKDLAEVLAELDADMARQEESIRQRRARLAQLLRQAEEGGRLSVDAPVSPALAALFEDMARARAQHPGPEPAMAVKDRELLALLESSAAGGDRSRLDALTHALKSDPKTIARAYEVYAQLDELSGAPESDPRVETAARAIVDSMPEGLLEAMGVPGGPHLNEMGESGFAQAFFADFTPAQAGAIRRAIQLLQEPAR